MCVSYTRTFGTCIVHTCVYTQVRVYVVRCASTPLRERVCLAFVRTAVGAPPSGLPARLSRSRRSLTHEFAGCFAADFRANASPCDPPVLASQPTRSESRPLSRLYAVVVAFRVPVCARLLLNVCVETIAKNRATILFYVLPTALLRPRRFFVRLACSVSQCYLCIGHSRDQRRRRRRRR